MADEQQSAALPNNEGQEGSEINFSAFVMLLARSAAVSFGDVPDPVSGATMEANLPAAQQMIDILSLLEAKTRGNLTAEERQLLEGILFELRMLYLEKTKPQSRIILP